MKIIDKTTRALQTPPPRATSHVPQEAQDSLPGRGGATFNSRWKRYRIFFTLTSEPRSLNFWARAVALHRDNTILYVKQQMSNRKKKRQALAFLFLWPLFLPTPLKQPFFQLP